MPIDAEFGKIFVIIERSREIWQIKEKSEEKAPIFLIMPINWSLEVKYFIDSWRQRELQSKKLSLFNVNSLKF